MIYGELGITPLYIDINTRIISFWTKLIDNPAINKLSSVVYSLIFQMHKSNKTHFLWIEKMKNILCSLGFSAIWYNQSFTTAKWLVKAVNQKLKDIFIQNWFSKVEIESESSVYRIFKIILNKAAYLSSTNNPLQTIYGLSH